MSEDTPQQTTPQPVKREYRTPELRVYGTVAAMTANTDMMGNRDGGPSSLKT